MRRVTATATVALLLVSSSALSGCRRSSRPAARTAFIAQLQQEGGLTFEVAQCIVDRFFAERSDQELKEFFDRTELSSAERDEFARLGQLCVPSTSDQPSAG